MSLSEQGGEFLAALKFLLNQEGGYVNDPADPGGETNFGISKRSHPNENIVGMTHDRAAQIYLRDYWIGTPPNFNRCDEMPYQIALPVFDFAVNAPAVVARKAFQKAVGAHQDGVLGPRSMEALILKLKRRSALQVGMRIIDIRLARYVHRVQSGSSSPKFLLGWMRRLHHLITAIYEEEKEK